MVRNLFQSYASLVKIYLFFQKMFYDFIYDFFPSQYLYFLCIYQEQCNVLITFIFC